MWTYTQRTGALTRDGQPVAVGYSGHGLGRNNPDLEQVPNVGPIPCGHYDLVALECVPPAPAGKHGPYVIRLAWNEAANEAAGNRTEDFHRNGFLIHGDNEKLDGSASEGCIILPRQIREHIWASGDRRLRVVREAEEMAIP